MPNNSDMKTAYTPHLFLLAIILFFNTAANAQFKSDNSNAMVAVLGKEAGSAEMNDLKTSHKLEAANDAHYISSAGVELLLRNGKVNEVRLFNKSAAYGAFKGKLPNGLAFGMGSGDVKRLLGKPTESYNNGYCEFEFPAYIISCWFDGGALSQVGLSAR